MKLEQISLRTGLLLALAGWAAAIWLATGFGLGSQLPTVSAEGDAQAALPALPVLAPERMAGADSYSMISERPLFAEDRKPRPYLLGGSEAAASPALRLTGVLMTGDFSMATFTTEQGRSLRLRLNGDAVDGWQLVALEPRQATVIGSSGSQVLELAVFNGQGGEAPTALRGATGTPPVPGAVVPPPPPQPTPSQTLPTPVPPMATWLPPRLHRPRPPHPLPTPTVPAKRRCRPSANASRPAAVSCSNSSNNRRRPRAMAPTDRVNA
ncbi:hypothetical protein [Stenotrophomonas indicatrix]|uniref:hypothetical protein n=1 Tax=Stenotrophomonas indicatrix TaxID=2045451 RepID=UPI003D81C038